MLTVAVGSRQFAVRSLVRSLIVCGLVGSAAGACRGPQQTYTTLPSRAEVLKQQFNADAGKTRILILPAPN